MLWLVIERVVSNPLDIVSTGMLWLVIGAISVCYLTDTPIFMISTKVLWWVLILILISRFLVSSLLLFYILFEIRLIPILLIIIIIGNQPERLSAGLYFLVYTTILSVPYLLFIVITLSLVRDFNNVDCIILGRLRVLAVTPFLVKIPVLGLHYWLPKAHVEANTSGSIVLAGLLLKLGRYGVIRIYLVFFIKIRFSVIWLLLRGLASLITLFQSDIKKLVAYSSVTHITFLCVGLFSNNTLMLFITLLLSLSHGWCSIGIFYSAGLSRHLAYSRLGVLIRLDSLLYWLILLIGLVLIVNSSIPPTPAFFSELGTVVCLLFYNRWAIILFIILSAIVLYYNAFLFFWFSYNKRYNSFSRNTAFLEGTTISIYFIFRVVSLGWLLYY